MLFGTAGSALAMARSTNVIESKGDSGRKSIMETSRSARTARSSCDLVVQPVLRNTAAFDDKALQEIILQSAISRDGSLRVEDCEQDRTLIARIDDSRQRADAAIGSRQSSCFSDDRAAIFLSGEASFQRSRIHTSGWKHILRKHVVEIQPKYELAKHRDGRARCDPVVIESGTM